MLRKIALSVVLSSTLLFSFTMNYTKDTTGLVRNIKVYKAPNWVAKVSLRDGKEFYFCSPKSLIEFYQIPGKWESAGVKSEEDFKNLIVTDFLSLKPIDAKGAFYVYGSNITSPAGDDLPAFESYAAAKEFASKHNGKRVFNFNEIKNSLIRLLNGRI